MTAPRDTVDLGTRERAHRQGGLAVGARVQTDGGIVVHHGAAARVECVLDALKEAGLLDGSEGGKVDRAAVARSRYEQGLWLRRLFQRAGLQPVRAFEPGTVRGTGDITDDMARARVRYNQTMRNLGDCGDTVVSFVCHDQVLRGEPSLRALRRGLDRLCVLRGP